MSEVMGNAALAFLKGKFNKNRNEETLMALLQCLKKSELILMVNVTMDQEDKDDFMNTTPREGMKNEYDVMLRPEVLEGEDHSHYISAFTTMDEIPSNTRARLMPISMDTIKCVELAHKTEEAEGIVIDAYTDPFVLSFDLGDLLAELPDPDPETEEDLSV